MAEQAFDDGREPIFWSSTHPGYNTGDRNRVTMKNGKAIHERIPQSGHQGSYDEKRPAKGRRWLNMLDHYGNVAPRVFTNAAAHMDTSTPYAQAILQQARFYGWVWNGACPCALKLIGDLEAHHFVDRSLVEAKPCEPNTYDEDKPCPHFLAEEKARKAANAAHNAEQEAAYKDGTARTIEANRDNNERLIEAMDQRNRELITALVEGKGKK